MFVSVTDTFAPLESGSASGLWITKSYDPSSHFEIAAEDILDIYQKITNETLDLNIEPDEDEGDYWNVPFKEINQFLEKINKFIFGYMY